MHVLIVSKNIGMMRGGGATRTLRFASGLAERGAEVTLVHARPLFGPLRHPVQGPFALRAVRAPYLRDLSYRLPKGRGLLPRIDDRIFAGAVRRAIRHELPVPDVFMTFGNFPLAAALKARFQRPVVVSSAGGLPSGRIAHHVRAVDAIIGDGIELAQFSKTYGVTPIEIRKGVDTAHFRPAPRSERDTAAIEPIAGPLRLLWTGRFVPVKNVPMALRVLAALERRGIDATLTLVGAGSLMGSLRHTAKELGVSERTRFTGHVAWEYLPHHYADADVFLLTSTFDNFPNSVLEAMASGLPVVSTRVGGVPEQVRDGEHGLLVPSDDVDAMADAVARLHGNRELRLAIGRRNRLEAETRYTWPESLDRLHRLCLDLVGPVREPAGTGDDDARTQRSAA